MTNRQKVDRFSAIMEEIKSLRLEAMAIAVQIDADIAWDSEDAWFGKLATVVDYEDPEYCSDGSEWTMSDTLFRLDEVVVIEEEEDAELERAHALVLISPSTRPPE